MFFFSNYSTKSKYYDSSNKLVVGKMKDETSDEFLGSKRKIYSYLVDDNSERKKAKGSKKNIVATISHIKWCLVDKKWLRHSMNRIQCKDRKTVIYEINKICFSCFEDKVYI